LGRKRKRIVRTRPIPTLPNVFDCPICGTVKSIHVDIDRKIRSAIITCGKCKIQVVKPVRPIEERVDVYGDWLDELLAEAEESTGIETEEKGSIG
jgi:transcription elongation factor Elf1